MESKVADVTLGRINILVSTASFAIDSHQTQTLPMPTDYYPTTVRLLPQAMREVGLGQPDILPPSYPHHQ